MSILLEISKESVCIFAKLPPPFDFSDIATVFLTVSTDGSIVAVAASVAAVVTSAAAVVTSVTADAIVTSSQQHL